MAAKRRRLDQELVEQGYFPDASAALRAVLAGEVSSRGERLTQPGTQVAPGVELHVKGRPRYVSRGGFKLEGALDAFGLDPRGLNCIDVGCSTGGFTDCLLQRGAARVCSVDVGRAQFAWSLRGDARVALFEDTNICTADSQALGAPFDLAVADVSFTSVAHILEAVCALLSPSGTLCTLVKPQFEAERSEVGSGGVVRDPAVHERVLKCTLAAFEGSKLVPQALCVSPIHGAKGNIEYFLLAQAGGAGGTIEVESVVESAWSAAAGA